MCRAISDGTGTSRSDVSVEGNSLERSATNCARATLYAVRRSEDDLGMRDEPVNEISNLYPRGGLQNDDLKVISKG